MDNNANRREIIRVNGIIILAVMSFVANLLVVGFVYQWHNNAAYWAEREYNDQRSPILASERAVKNEIVELEGVSAWNNTLYVEHFPQDMD